MTRLHPRTNGVLRIGGRSLLLAGIAVGAIVSAFSAETPVVRVVGNAGDVLERAGTNRAGSRAPARLWPERAPDSVQVFTVDTELYTGFENAIYAPNVNTVYVAYKRLLTDPAGGGYNPAELRVAKSTNGGRDWDIQILDTNAIEQGDTLDGSVSIDGDRGSTVYVAYHTRASGSFLDMKLKVAKSTDAGANWTIQTVDDFSGDQNGIRVLGSSSAVVSAHAAGADEGVRAYLTTDGGATWSEEPIEGGLGNGYYTSVGGTNARTFFVSYYNSLYPDHQDAHGARRTRDGSWRSMLIQQGPITGLGSSAWVAPGPTVYVAYEEDNAQGAFANVAKLEDGANWTIVPVEQGFTVGWNTAIHGVGTSDLYVSYWRYESGIGDAVLGHSADGGTTWSVLTIPEDRSVVPYLDSTSPSTSVQFVSYQTVDPVQYDQPILRVARVGS